MIAVGAAYGTSKAGIGIAGLGTFKPELIMKVRRRLLWCLKLAKGLPQSLIPVVMSGIIAVYGLVVSVLIAGARKSWKIANASSISLSLWTVRPHDYSLFAGFVHLGAGFACGATGLAAGYAIGHIGDSVIIILSLTMYCMLNLWKPVCTSLCLWI